MHNPRPWPPLVAGGLGRCRGVLEPSMGDPTGSRPGAREARRMVATIGTKVWQTLARARPDLPVRRLARLLAREKRSTNVAWLRPGGAAGAPVIGART